MATVLARYSSKPNQHVKHLQALCMLTPHMTQGFQIVVTNLNEWISNGKLLRMDAIIFVKTVTTLYTMQTVHNNWDDEISEKHLLLPLLFLKFTKLYSGSATVYQKT